METQIFTSLLQELELLQRIVTESPYLTKRGRVQLGESIRGISSRLAEGTVVFGACEKEIGNLNKEAADQEIESVLIKLSHLNPSSPRLQTLRHLKDKLKEGELSPDQARKALNDLMKT